MKRGCFVLLAVPGYAYVAGPDYTVSVHPKDQGVSMIAIADDYRPKRCSVDLVETKLRYEVDMETAP